MSDDRTTDPAPAGLRCPECGEVRTPAPGVVLCEECRRRALARPRAFYPGEKPEPAGRFRGMFGP